MRLRPNPDLRAQTPEPNRRPVALVAAAAQLAAGVLTFAFAQFAGTGVPGFALLFLQGGLAAAFAWQAGLPWWWLPLEFLFVPALAAMLSVEIAPAWFLAAFILLALIYWSTYRTRVPLYLSGPGVWRALDALLPSGGRVMDLGSGLGGPLRYLAARHPELAFEGIEAAPLPHLLSRLRGRSNLRFRFGSFWKRSLHDQDFVFAYLSPAAMPSLWRKLQAEMRPGSIFVSVEFPVPGVAPHEVLRIGEGSRACLYVWRF